jgi:hypothetical protein
MPLGAVVEEDSADSGQGCALGELEAGVLHREKRRAKDLPLPGISYGEADSAFRGRNGADADEESFPVAVP